MAKKDDTLAPNAKANPLAGFSLFLDEVKGELKKVIWPTRQQLISESFAVILMVVASATLIYLVDRLFLWLSGRLFP